MNRIPLQVSELTAEAFKPFGNVIQATGDFRMINRDTTKRFHDLADINVSAKGGRPLFNIFRATPVSRPVAVTLLERHPLSSQTFFPLDNRAYLVLVAPAGDEVDISNIRTFLARGRQGVNYHRGVWHHPLLALDVETDFIVIDRGGEEKNCEEFYFPADTEIYIDY